MDVIKSLLLKLAERIMDNSKSKEYVVFYPLMVWASILMLAQAGTMVRGNLIANWIRATLMIVTAIAPWAIDVGKLAGFLFAVLYLGHWVGMKIAARAGKISGAQWIHNGNLQDAELAILTVVLGWISVFAIPYRADVPGCIWTGYCSSPLEAYMLAGVMGGYLGLLALALARKTDVLAKKADQEAEARIQSWVEGKAGAGDEEETKTQPAAAKTGLVR